MTAEFRDESGSERLRGSLLIGGTAGQVATVQADGTIAPQAGAASTAHEQIGGNVVNIADAANAPLTWDTANGPDTLLNLAVPTVPTIITAGVYAIGVVTTAAAITAGGSYLLRLELDRAGDDFTYSTQTTGPAVRAALFPTYFLPAGAEVVVTVFNFDGAAARDFNITSATVQRLA